jgi:hypothetical protein
MPRRVKDPVYRLHKKSAQAIVTLPTGAGARRDVYLGEFNSKESWEKYDRTIAEWKANGRHFVRSPPNASRP